MDGMMIFQLTTTVIGVGVPVGTLIYNAGKFGQRITNLEKNHTECRGDRIKKEEEFCDRITDVEIAQAYQKGLKNGAKP